MEFPSTKGTCHGYLIDRCSDHAASPAHAAGHVDAGLGPHTQQHYVRHVRRFARFLGRAPDAATTDDIRRFQLLQHESGVGPATINGAVSALRFSFLVTLKRRDLARALLAAKSTSRLRMLPTAQPALVFVAKTTYSDRIVQGSRHAEHEAHDRDCNMLGAEGRDEIPGYAPKGTPEASFLVQVVRYRPQRPGTPRYNPANNSVWFIMVHMSDAQLSYVNQDKPSYCQRARYLQGLAVVQPRGVLYMSTTTRRDFVALTGVAATALAGAIATPAAAAAVQGETVQSFEDVEDATRSSPTDFKAKVKLAIYVALAKMHADLEHEFEDFDLKLPLGSKVVPQSRVSELVSREMEPQASLIGDHPEHEDVKTFILTMMRFRAATARSNAELDTGSYQLLSHKG